MRTIEPLEPLRGLDEHLARWVADGVVSADQADRIRAEERTVVVAGEPRRTSLLTEALAYLGGVLVLVASILLVSRVWHDLSTGARLGLVGAAALLLLAGGALLPAAPGTTGQRLRSAVWALGTGASAMFLALLANEVFDLDGVDVALFVTAGTAAVAGALWWLLPVVLQQVVFFGALGGAATAALIEVTPDRPSGTAAHGLGFLALGVLWMALAGQGPLQPQRLSRLLGAAGVFVASMMMLAGPWGRPVSLLCAAGLVLVGLRLGDLALLLVGTVAVLIVLPAVMMVWFPGAVAAPLALLLCGGLLVLVALRALRSRERR